MDTLIPDVIRESAPRHGLAFAQLVERERRPLPPHEIKGGNFRQWAAAVCTAEANHREADYLRVERELGVSVDRWAYPNCISTGQFLHEAHAGAALVWLSHLQAHETMRRRPMDFSTWRLWSAERRAKWLSYRRYLWRGFLAEVRAYQKTKGSA